MKNIFTTTNLVTATCSVIFALPAFANPSDRLPAIFQTSDSENNSVLPADNAADTILVATVTNNIQFDIGKNQPQSIDLILAQPFKSFPTGSRIRAMIQPSEDGNAVLIADLLYGNSGVLQIDAQSEILYGQTATVSDRATEAAKRTATTAPLGGLAGLALGKDVEESIQYTAATGVIGATTGILSPQKVQLLNLIANRPILFTLN